MTTSLDRVQEVRDELVRLVYLRICAKASV
jgi:hypothetical protein